MPPRFSLRPTQKLLWRHLWFWTLGALTLVWLTLMGVARYGSQHETEEISDGYLLGVAQLWLSTSPARMDELPQALPRQSLNPYAQDLAIMEWQGSQLVIDTHKLSRPLGLSSAPAVGLSTQQESGTPEPRRWRMAVAEAPATAAGMPPRRVAVLVNLVQQVNVSDDVLAYLARSALLELPLVALGLWWTIRRGLRPLDQLSAEVARLDVRAGQRVSDPHRFREFSSIVQAINTLVDSLQAQAQRERSFASDVAHELRTPLSAIAVQARAAQREPTPEHLAQLEQEALRAGRILTQLLDLARAHRDSQGSPPGEPLRPVNLETLAAELLARHAQRAYESGHELSLVATEPPVEIYAQIMLLELAVGNLIDNALRHTPPGTQVCVHIWQTPQAVGLSVSDDGQRQTSPQPHPSSGLGLGLRLVERLAEQMGAQFQRDTAPPPMTTRFTLRWQQTHGGQVLG